MSNPSKITATMDLIADGGVRTKYDTSRFKRWRPVCEIADMFKTGAML
jgi:hypothetical protein